MTRDTEMVGDMDPYVQIHYDGNIYKTQILDEGGKHPVWNMSFDISIKNISDEITFVVYDKDITMSDEIGRRTLIIKDIVEKDGYVDKFFLIKYDHKRAGELRIRGTQLTEAGLIQLRQNNREEK